MSTQIRRRIKIVAADLRRRLVRFWKRFKYVPKFFSILLIALVGMSIVYWFYKNESSKEEAIFAMQLDNAAADRSNAIQANISKSIELMYVQGQAIQQIISSRKTTENANLDIDTFFAITQEAIVHNPNPSFDAIQWAPRIEKKAADNFLKKAQDIYSAEGTEYAFSYLEEPNSDYIFPVLFSQTLTGEENLGLDLYSSAAFKKYMDISKEVGVATASTKIEIVEGQNSSIGFVVFLPVYTKPYKKLDILERDTELLGFLVERITLSNLVNQSLLNLDQSKINFEIYDSLVENNSDVLYSYSAASRISTDKAPSLQTIESDNTDKKLVSGVEAGDSLTKAKTQTNTNDPLLVKVYSVFGALVSPLVQRRATELADKLKSTTDIDVGGFKWRLVFKIDPEQIIEDSSPIKWLLMSTVALVTLFLCGYMLFLILHTVQVEKEVRVRTKKLLTAKRNLELYSIELQELSEKLSKLANHDPLTGLLNRRAFEQVLKDELYRAQRYNLPLSVLLLDIDYFKKVNDGFGHQVGDLLLTECAEKFKNRMRDSDYVCRFGGEEFIFLLPNTNLDGGWSMAESIRKSIEDYDFSCIGLPKQVTVSIGLATSTSAFMLDAHSIVLYADKGVYMSKERGRNQVNCFQLTDTAQTAAHTINVNTNDLASTVS